MPTPNIISCPPILKAKQLECGILDYKPGPGMEIVQCQTCGTPAHIGPRQRQYLSLYPLTPVLCHGCAIILTGPGRATTDLGGTGGTYLV